MSLQLEIEYSDLLQLVQQLSGEELQRLKKDVNRTIKAHQKIPQLLQYLIGYFKGIEEALNTHQLNALLYLIDFGHYALYEKSITGFTYQKSSAYPFSPNLKDLLKLLKNKEILTKIKVDGDKFILNVENAPSFKKLRLSKQEKKTIKKTLNYFEELDDFDFSKEIQYHYSWFSTDNGEVMDYEKSKHCTFEWLDYYQDNDKEAYEEAKETRKLLSQNDEINDLFKQIQNL
ncbi:MAG: type II toxin-antitoxin system antitoxin SocA domain-containing protein [Chitinophagales bacterium]